MAECSGLCFGICLHFVTTIPAGIYLFKDNNGNCITMCEICHKSTIKTPERCQRRRSGVLIDFKQVDAGWGVVLHNFRKLIFLIVSIYEF